MDMKQMLIVVRQIKSVSLVMQKFKWFSSEKPKQTNVFNLTTLLVCIFIRVSHFVQYLG